jgi:hypothetical protein
VFFDACFHEPCACIALVAFVCLQLRLKEVDEATFKRVMGLTEDDADWNELPPGVGVEPE